MRALFRFFRHDSAAAELAEEMREHLDEKVDQLIAAGMSRADAEREARRRFGNLPLLGERSRDVWGFAFAENLVQDLRYAVRSLRKTPLFAAAVILPLALGIGANTAIYTVVHAALIRALPYKQPDRLVHLWETNPGKEHGVYEASFPDFQDWRTANRYLESVAGYVGYGLSATLTDGGEPEQLVAASATSDFFPLLGVRAAIGRTFEPGEDQPGARRALLLSNGFWRRRFHSDPSVVGRSVVLNSAPFTVVGVLPADFHFASVGDAEVWMPAVGSPNQRISRYWHWMRVIGRLRPGATLEQARAELGAIGERIVREDPSHHQGSSIAIQPLREVFIGDIRPALLVLLGAIGMVLLLACANVANLLLARASARRKELAIRKSIGAGRGRLVQQLLTENLVLAAAGGALGLLFANWGLKALTAAIPAQMRGTLPFLDDLGLHWGMLAFTGAVSLATGVLFGLSPALRSAKVSLGAVLESGHRTTGGREHLRLRHALLVAEVAISLVLLTGAGLMMKSTARLLAVSPGFDPSHLLTLEIALPPSTYNTSVKAKAFHDRMMERIGAIAGVRATASTSVLSLTNGGNTGTLQVVGRPDTSEKITVYVRDISTEYLRAMGIPLLAGRSFDARDVVGATRVVLINRRLMRDAFPNEDPIGRRISFPWSGGPLEIAGVVGDENTVGLDTELRPVVYFAYAQGPNRSWDTVVSASGAPAAIAAAVRAEVRAIDPNVPVYLVRTMQQVIDDAPSTLMRRYPAMLMGAFAAIALLIAAIGTYGLVAYGVSRRMHEIGVRIALGARPTDIFRLVMGQGMVLVLVGIGAGLAAAALLTRGLEKLLFGVKPLDLATFALVSAVLLVSALAASFLPARRASRIPPGTAMGSE
jgi:predicted permease